MKKYIESEIIICTLDNDVIATSGEVQTEIEVDNQRSASKIFDVL